MRSSAWGVRAFAFKATKSRLRERQTSLGQATTVFLSFVSRLLQTSGINRAILKIERGSISIDPEDLSRMNPTLHQLGIDRLSVSERIELMGLFWDSIAHSDEMLPIPEWHQHELEKRLAAAETDPQGGVPRKNVKARLM